MRLLGFTCELADVFCPTSQPTSKLGKHHELAGKLVTHIDPYCSRIIAKADHAPRISLRIGSVAAVGNSSVIRPASGLRRINAHKYNGHDYHHRASKNHDLTLTHSFSEP
jgi:hypothetical protein